MNGSVMGAPFSSVKRTVACPVTTRPVMVMLSGRSPRFCTVCGKQISWFSRAF